MSDSSAEAEITGKAAEQFVSYQVLTHLRWRYRDQTTLDYGIDGQVEISINSKPSGRLLAVQVKGGPRFFREETEDGWIFRPEPKHVRYWLGHVLPVIVVLVNLDARVAYWQQVNHETLQSTGLGYKILVPRTQTIEGAREHWLQIAEDQSPRAQERFKSNLDCLPPSAALYLNEVWLTEPAAAAWLALYLADGRLNPELTTETLLAGEPGWLKDAGAAGWCVVGAYASEHNLARASALAYQRAADLDPERNGRLLAIAGLQLTDSDKEEAAVLLERARRLPSGELLSNIGTVLVTHPADSSHPFEIPAQLEHSIRGAQDEPTAQAFLAMQAQRERRTNDSIAHFTNALRLRPKSSSYMLGLADAYVKRALSDPDRVGDLNEALTVASVALEQRRSWDGNSTEALVLILRILALQDNYEEIIRKGAKEPHGEARAQEACERKVVRTVLEAAQLLDADDVIHDVLDSLEDIEYKERLMLVFCGDLAKEKQVQIAEVELIEAEETRDYEMVISSVMRLASLGVNRVSHLDRLVDQGITEPETCALASALLAASTDLDRAIPALRSLADVDKVAAQNLVILLARAGRFDEADAACLRAYDRLHDLELMILRFEVAVGAGRLETAEVIGRELIADPAVIGLRRARINRFFAEQATRREDWESAERYLRQSLRVISSAGDKWNLVRVQLNQRRYSQAADTIRQNDLNPQEIDAARVWFRAMLGESWDDELVSHGLALAGRFANDRDFSGTVIKHIISSTRGSDEEVREGEETEQSDLRDARTQISSDLRRQAFLALEAHADMHGDDGSIRRFDFSPEKLIEYLAQELSSIDKSPIRDLIKSIRQGTAPLGMLAFAAGKPYSQIVTERSAGVFPASSPDVDMHSLEMETALASLGKPVVVEAGALHLSTSIGQIESLRGLFADIFLPAISRDDIVETAVRVRGLTASAGFLGWDEKLKKLTFYEMSAEQRAMLWERVEALDDVARNTSIKTVGSLSLFSDFNSDVRLWPWLAPIELASKLRIALWCDDSALRQLARSVGVPSFGTPALVEAVLSSRIEEAAASANNEALAEAVSEQQQFVRDLMAQSVVDLPVSLDELLSQAERDNWAATIAATQLTRASWWKWNRDPIEDLLAIYRKVAEGLPEALPMWQTAAMYGAADNWRMNPVGASVVVALVALVGFDENVDVNSAGDGLLRAAELAEYLNIPDPRELIVPAINILHRMGRVSDPETLREQLSEGN